LQRISISAFLLGGSFGLEADRDAGAKLALLTRGDLDCHINS